MVTFKENSFPKVPEGVQHFLGVVQLFPWVGVRNCLFPIEIHITFDFPGGPDPLSPPPLCIRPWSSQKVYVCDADAESLSQRDIWPQ